MDSSDRTGFNWNHHESCATGDINSVSRFRQYHGIDGVGAVFYDLSDIACFVSLENFWDGCEDLRKTIKLVLARNLFGVGGHWDCVGGDAEGEIGD